METVLTNAQCLVLVLFGLGAMTLLDFTLFYIYSKAYPVNFTESIQEEPIGARIRELNRVVKNKSN
jgi:predicted DNA-binding transcriptional regulator